MLEFVKESDKENGALRFIARGVGKKRYSGLAGRGYARFRDTAGKAGAAGRGYGNKKSKFREFPFFEVSRPKCLSL